MPFDQPRMCPPGAHADLRVCATQRHPHSHPRSSLFSHHPWAPTIFSGPLPPLQFPAARSLPTHLPVQLNLGKPGLIALSPKHPNAPASVTQPQSWKAQREAVLSPWPQRISDGTCSLSSLACRLPRWGRRRQLLALTGALPKWGQMGSWLHEGPTEEEGRFIQPVASVLPAG